MAETPDILKKIMHRKAEEVLARAERLPLRELQASAADAPPTRGFADALASAGGGGRAGGDRRDQEGVPQQGGAAGGLPPGGDRRQLCPRRGHLSVGPDRSRLLPGQRGLPHRGQGRLHPAGDPQGLHRRPLSGLRGARHGGRLHPADRRLPGGRRPGGPERPGGGTGPGHPGGGPRRRGTGPRARPYPVAWWASTTGT